MKRFGILVFACLLASSSWLRADQTTATVQQALKEQGFYYGDVTGQKSADTIAAIRRYQIRNGLQITGEIDAETLRSLGVGNRSAGVRATPAPAATPAAPTAEEEAGQSAEIPAEREPATQNLQRPAARVDTPETRAPEPGMSDGVFAGTPYEIAPPDVQRHVVVGAQALLARVGYYRSGIDGNFGPGSAAAVRAFQAQAGLAVDGRLNMETLAALGLLPGQHPARLPSGRRPFFRRPVYRGEWVPE
jgi:peptidoglycan hydrolase-like protein with peptidoglycan-binding domain